ncbi:class I SAM-dependent methyltransferase [Tropicibacter oceani]|uniref:Class I SAM-dependent methyltransferase n=1 Tax=Tropicibacter oceani TaxID=3058420 RepID=A0ABY8QN59_9RHOB|nr:class I SAM-dependent methyltransferase [Tropicibacter oceani]WGW06056.1 class I SAM-dependent methyltransferase [Tropicibacter oceani]
MSWVSKYYDRRVAAGAQKGLFWQVGHTEQGRPISSEQFAVMLDSLGQVLQLGPGSSLLDLCCGNGVFTRQLAAGVQRAVGVDFSPAMIAVARAECAAPNLTYQVVDVKRIPPQLAGQGKFDRILMNAALQHFSLAEFRTLLTRLLQISTPDRVIVFAFVPNAARRTEFDRRLKPGLALRLRRLFRRDLVTHWYHQDDVRRICDELGLRVRFRDPDPAIAGAWYRHDIVIEA